MKIWPIKKLGEIASVDWGNTSITKASYKPSGYLAISATGPDGFMDFFEHDCLAIILSAIGAKCGKTFWVEGKWTAIKNTITIFSDDENICLTKYLYYFLTPNKWKIVGGGQPFITKGAAESVKIPLPPLAIQKQIVEQLDKIVEAQKLNDELIQKTDELFQSLLHKELNPAGPADPKAMEGKKNWEIKKLGEVLDYEQPTKYIVSSTDYKNEYLIPVLTAGKSFVLGNTNEKNGIFPKEELPVIIFDDFTTAIKFVDFPFKVKSSAMKILHAIKGKADINFLFYTMKIIKFFPAQHKRYWISEYSQIKIPLPPLETQKQIVSKLSAVQDYKKQLLEQKSKLKELFDSVLSKTMQGKIIK